ncbi:hypothetical protein ABLE91_20900 [Aquabacter sp. CN5-332]|uniref:hypothetical protein n=1 Tax=Aquabacter sp. CN5-332 TaxID=3156608 RepID=UPI0032B31AA9
MTREQLEHLVAIHGSDMAGWPTEDRSRAEEFLRRAPEARSLLAEEACLDARLAGAYSRQLTPADEAAGRSALARLLATPLPPQNRSATARWLPSWLLAFDLRPSWPSIAALAGMALLGIFVGSYADHAPSAPPMEVARATPGPTMFEPAPLLESGL